MANETINQQSEDGSPTSDDFVLMWDVATGTTKKVTIANLLLLLANDSVTDAKLIYGKIRSRQGGSATDFTTPGTTAYDYSGTNVLEQTGTRSLNTEGNDIQVTFDYPFGQKPHVFVQVITTNSANITTPVLNVLTTGFKIRSIGGDGSNEQANWRAIGVPA